MVGRFVRGIVGVVAHRLVVARICRGKRPALGWIFRDRPRALVPAVVLAIGDLETTEQRIAGARLGGHDLTRDSTGLARAMLFEATARMPEAVRAVADLPDQLVRSARPLLYCYRLLLEGGSVLDFAGAHLNPDELLTIAGHAITAQQTELAHMLYDRAISSVDVVDSIRARWLRYWLEADHADSTANVPRLAVIDYRHPDLFRASINMGDWVQTVAALSNVARYSAVEFTGASDVVSFVNELRPRVEESNRMHSPGQLELSAVQRDVTDLDDVAPGTWLLAYGWYMWPKFAESHNMPFHRNLRPLFLSFHCNVPEMLTPDAEHYLRQYGPIGCRDWSTVTLLLDRGIPAFFSGCITSTLGNVVRRALTATQSAELPVAYVDLNPPNGVDISEVHRLTQADADVLGRDLGDNLTSALDLLDHYRDDYRSVVTSRLHCYLPCRAIGTDVKMVPSDPNDIRFDGLLDIDELSFDSMATGISDKLAAAIGWIVDGASEDDVYAGWRELCAPDVAAAKFRRSA